MNAAKLIDVIDKIYFITDEDRKKYPILKDLTMVYRPYDSIFAKITLNDAIEYAKKCRVFECDDWRLPHLMGKCCGEIDFKELKKYSYINRHFPCMKREFIENVSEIAAIIDIFTDISKDKNSNDFLCLNECWYYYTDNTYNNTFMLMAGDGFPCWTNNDKGNDFILVR